MRMIVRRAVGAGAVASLAALLTWSAPSFAQPAAGPVVYGPYNVDFPSGGEGAPKRLAAWGARADIPAAAPWSLYGWVQPSEIVAGRAPVVSLGAPGAGGRVLTLEDGRPAIWTAAGVISAPAPLVKGAWRFLAAVSDGSVVRLYVDGVEVARGAAAARDTAASLELAPRKVAGAAPYAGKVAGVSASPVALSATDISALAARPFAPDLIVFATGSPTWPVQARAWVGLLTPQDAWTLPKSKAPVSRPTVKPAYDGPSLRPDGPEAWTLAKWRLVEAPKTTAGGAEISEAGFDAKTWYPATVPGTVLTTLVDRGVYPDPEYDLNNMAIPESLARQDYWYRAAFETPQGLNGRRLLLTFKGINYAAAIWVNGERVGDIKGAFIRGQFDVTSRLKPTGVNAVAVRISPPPHPGIPHEQSIKAGAGENGGMEALDGPTFIATEGWDWIPGVRDRNSGLWQDVVLSASGVVRLGDAHVVTTLPKPDNSEADVEITVPVENLGATPVDTTVTAAFDDVRVSKTVTVAPGKSEVVLAPAEFPQLAVAHPRLWWPNGYGAPALHTARLTAMTQGTESDRRDVRFGMRQITYELSLMDSTGHLRRVEIDPARARQLGQVITDGSHEGVRKVVDGWAASLAPGAEASPAVHELPPTTLTPYLVIKVNGARIAARGGSWGMDDWRKRVSRARLEPFFQLCILTLYSYINIMVRKKIRNEYDWHSFAFIYLFTRHAVWCARVASCVDGGHSYTRR